MNLKKTKKFFYLSLINLIVFFSIILSIEGLTRFRDFIRFGRFDHNYENQKTNFWKDSYPNTKKDIYELIPGLYFGELVKDSVKYEFNISNNGFREKNFDPQREIDIAIFGDSFTFGSGVTKRFSDYLIELTDLNIANFSYNGGFTSPHYLLYFLNNDQLNPNKVFVFTYLGNDCESDLNESKIISVEEGGYPQRIIEDGNLVGDKTKYPSYVKILNKSLFMRKIFERIYISEFGPLIFKHLSSLPNRPNSKKFDLGIDKNACLINWGYLKNLEKECKKRNENCELVNFLIPQNFLVYTNPKNPHTLLDYNERIEAYNNKKLIKNVIDNSIKLGLKTIDLSEYLDENDYLNHDGHFNSNGHSKVSNIIIKYLNNF